jgi:hypothetical protein
MSFISSFTSYITDPIKSQIGTIKGGIQQGVSALNKGINGPLASLDASQNKYQLDSSLKYPLDLDSPTGPHQNWILFKILKSVSSTDTSPGGFAGEFNLNGFKPAAQATDLLNKAIGKVNSFVSDQIGDSNLLNSVGFNATQFLSPQRRTKATGVTIALYVPQTVQFNQTNNYSDTSLTAQLGMALGAIQAGTSLAQGEEGAAGRAASEIGGALTGVDTNLVLFKATGTVLNPQIEVIFQQTDMRTFQFDFVFAARSVEEQDQVHKIVEMFRYAAAPTIAGNDGRYLIPPDEFDIEFHFGGISPSPMIPRISTSVLTSVQADYAPSGAFAVFDDGRPISTRLTLQFKEVEMIHKARVAEGF